MTPLEIAARKYAEASWRHDILETDETRENLQSAADGLHNACEAAYPMPDNME
jgi:hypothetical protein